MKSKSSTKRKCEVFAASQPIGLGQVEIIDGSYQYSGSITGGLVNLNRNDLAIKVDGIDATISVTADGFGDRIGFYTGRFITRTEEPKR